MKYCDKEENVGFIQFPDFCVTFVFDFKEQKFSKWVRNVFPKETFIIVLVGL